MDIQYSGIKLNASEKQELSNTIAGYARKEHTRLFKISIKAHDIEGKRQRFVVSLNITTDFGRFSSEESGWVLTKSVREAIRKVEKQVAHAMKDQD